MANNRLYIYDRETGDKFCLCKTMGAGWYPFEPDGQPLGPRLWEWIRDRDQNASGFKDDGKTQLFLVTENDPAFYLVYETGE